ncbi:MAG: hemolysin family protein [Chloroflexota bacterium]|nr:hemolysin family protein [Chloroflexota bacterium]
MLLFLCVALSAFFSSTEVAFLSIQRARLLTLVRRGTPGADRVAKLAERPDRLLPTVLLGNNLVNTAAAALGTAVVLTMVNDVNTAILISTIGVTVLLLVLGETLPKMIAARHALKWAFVVVRPLELVELLFFPVVRLLQLLSGAIMRFFGGQPAPAVTEEEIRTMIVTGRDLGLVEHGEAQMLENVFRFGDRPVREVMTPRTEVAWVEKGTTLQKFMALYAKQPHTRYPVFAGTQDHVIGVISVKDMLQRMAEGKLNPNTSVTHPLSPMHFVPDTKLVGALFAELQKRGQRLAVVVDEFGGVAGIVTIQQLLEVIVGPVGPAGAPGEMGYVTVGENTYRIDASMGIEEVNQKLALGLPIGEYDTVAGFLLERLGHIPRQGEQLEYRGRRFTVSKMDGVRIEEVIVARGSPVVDEGGK